MQRRTYLADQMTPIPMAKHEMLAAKKQESKGAHAVDATMNSRLQKHHARALQGSSNAATLIQRMSNVWQQAARTRVQRLVEHQLGTHVSSTHREESCLLPVAIIRTRRSKPSSSMADVPVTTIYTMGPEYGHLVWSPFIPIA